ncbi:uncharacterized mitochondrial protein AtMg00810-like [Amaranthus tricolor]|uniref:uncharacterized mitochondrial protein AtMg00810-like n=1 Tax=Amaranthus tricolor TaxID=29722 RepID=UPI00258FFE44|nr:uncharacterized mitochondrial protein AtMg00810-like [Amaranthus tricolor]
MRRFGYEQSNSDHTLFLKKGEDRITCLIIYVDDMIITGNNKEEISDHKEKLFKEFEMKDLGNLKYFLGIEVFRSKRGIFINQKKYIFYLLAEIGMIDSKPTETPIVTNHRLQTTPGENSTDKENWSCELIYAPTPDISYGSSHENLEILKGYK